MKKIIVVAPHPDDETLGCGGTLLRHRAVGDELHWLIVTSIFEENGFSPQKIMQRSREIEEVAHQYGFTEKHLAGFPTTRLDTVPNGDLVHKISTILMSVQPEIIYVPYRGDVHTDHHHVFDAVISCTKWFRYPFVKKILAYETLSETEFGINPDANGFRPNYFVDISQYLERKLEIMRIYESEMGPAPFPRSEEAISALAVIRGAAAGTKAAEAFMLLKEIIS